MKFSFLVPAGLVLSLAACGDKTPPAGQAEAQEAAAPAQVVLKSGEDVYKQVCLACHASGVAGAPKAGEQGGWAALADEGQAVVTAHGWVGVRGMPPKGGRADLSLEEFARATAWMARSAGVDWQDPDEHMLHEIREEEEKRIEELKKRR